MQNATLPPDPSPVGEKAPVDKQATVGGCLLRVFWIFGGNAALVLLGILILLDDPWSFGVRDIAYWAIAAGMLVARYVDITRFAGKTAEGRDATLADLRRHAVLMAIASTVLWAVAHSVQLLGG